MHRIQISVLGNISWSYHYNKFQDVYKRQVISNALGHSSVKVTETYLKPFENEALDKANKKIIAYVKKCGNR